jgi:hypothetical protein
VAAIAVAFRSQLMFAVRFVKTLMTDQRVPRPLRWLIGISLAIKVIPFPDFGLDEVVLIVVGLVLVTFCRPALRTILEETRAVDAARIGSARKAALNMKTQRPSNAKAMHPPTPGRGLVPVSVLRGT